MTSIPFSLEFHVRPRHVAAGEHVSAMMHDTSVVGLLDAGTVLVVALDEEGQEVFAYIRHAPAAIGLERLAGQRIAYELEALTDVDIALVPEQQLHTALQREPELSRQLAAGLAAELGRSYDERLALHGTALMRVARLLLGHAQDAPPLPRQTLARVLAMRPETLSRVLRKLSDQGIVDSDEQTIRVLDPPALEALLRERRRPR